MRCTSILSIFNVFVTLNNWGAGGRRGVFSDSFCGKAIQVTIMIDSVAYDKSI